MTEVGTLYILATPIGNLSDLTFRGKEVLERVDIIACEDTRRTRKLLTHYQIEKPTMRYDEHTHEKASTKIQELLNSGKDVALVSNAGTPAISDPGSRLVGKLREDGMEITPVPGPSAVITALSVSGFHSDRFVFLGFLPKKSGKRKKLLKSISELDMPVAIFLPPRRLNKRLSEIEEVLGDREAVFCRELTKYYETIIYGNLSRINDIIEDDMKGEITLVVNCE